MVLRLPNKYWPTVIAEEWRMLDVLTAVGIPTPEVIARGTYLHPITRQVVFADVQPRYATSSKDLDWLDALKTFGNSHTAQDLDRIETILGKQKIAISDLQFLIGADGHLYVHDPKHIYRRRHMLFNQEFKAQMSEIQDFRQAIASHADLKGYQASPLIVTRSRFHWRHPLAKIKVR